MSRTSSGRSFHSLSGPRSWKLRALGDGGGLLAAPVVGVGAGGGGGSGVEGMEIGGVESSCVPGEGEGWIWRSCVPCAACCKWSMGLNLLLNIHAVSGFSRR